MHIMAPSYVGVPLVPEDRPHLVAAVLSADRNGLIEPPDSKRWFSRDMNELSARRLALQWRRRADGLWSYRLTPDGLALQKQWRRARLKHLLPGVEL